MLVKNLKIILSEKQGEKSVFKTENGAEITIDNSLVEKVVLGQSVYLALDEHPLVSGQEDKKKLLNELLNPED